MYRRWDIDASEQLPSYMKLSYRALVQVYNETEKELENLGNKMTYRVKYSINEVIKELLLNDENIVKIKSLLLFFR